MKLGAAFFSGLAIGLVLLGWAGRGATQDGPETPIGPKWWPSEWGPADQRGAANRLTADRVKDAARLIRSGKVYSLGRVYEHGMPLPGKRHFSLTIPGSPTGGPSGKNQGVYHDDLFSGEIGQIGTQLDGLGHVGVRIDGDDYFYNGFRRSTFGTAYGLEKLGIENVGVFFTRGVLVDVAASRGVERMKSGEVIKARDLEAALIAQRVEVREGDIVLIRTGYGQLWMKDNAAYGAGEPGIGMEAARWLAGARSSWSAPTPGRPRSCPPRTPIAHSPSTRSCSPATGSTTSRTSTSRSWPATRSTSSPSSSPRCASRAPTGSPGNPIAVR